ncbi:MAG: hypothetical protein GY744_17505 [Gammaproteobacteria bacterium]|nr:hypothetical protein [Gammaproteobacteria bacterium]
MIVQEINLYQSRFKEKKILLSVSHLLLLTGLTVLILSFSSYWYAQQFDLAERQHSAKVQEKERASMKLEVLQGKLKELLADNRIDRGISKVSTDIAVRKRKIKFVADNQFGSGKGFSRYLSGLTEIKIKDIWLNEISLAEGYMQLSGSALKAELVPEYFNLFRQNKIFNGKVFEVFELDREQSQDWKVDFLIASRVTPDE